jgi:hypothetical protein
MGTSACTGSLQMPPSSTAKCHRNWTATLSEIQQYAEGRSMRTLPRLGAQSVCRVRSGDDDLEHS